MKKKFVIPIIGICLVTIILTVSYILFMCPLVVPGNGSGEVAMIDDSIKMSTEFPVYDKTCEYVTIIIENNSGSSVEFDSEWSLEKKVLGTWMYIPFQSNAGFDSIAFNLDDGDEISNTCYISQTNGEMSNGKYRIIKVINGVIRAVEFEIGKSEITAETPFGYESLGTMEEYDYDVAVEDGVFIINTGENEENMIKFMKAVQMPGRESQIRIGALNEHNELLITDIFRSRDGAYRVTTWNQNEFSELRKTVYASSSVIKINEYVETLNNIMPTKYYSYLVTDGEQLYLSNYSKYIKNNNNMIILSSDSQISSIRDYIINDLETEDSISYKVYSDDGTYSAQVNEVQNSDKLEFVLSEAGNSSRLMLNRENLNNPSEAKIVEFIWQSDNTLVIKAEDGSDYYYEFRNPETFEVIAYTHSEYEYIIENGIVMIPE